MASIARRGRMVTRAAPSHLSDRAHLFTALRLLRTSDHAKVAEILALRHPLAVLGRQLGSSKVKFSPADRVVLAALLAPLPRALLRRLRLLVRPDTTLRRHRNLLRRRHARASYNKQPGRPRTVRSIRALVLRLALENSTRGNRRIHGELATLGIKTAASTVREILHHEGTDPAPQRTTVNRAAFLRSRTDALLAMDFIETITLTGQRQHTLATIEHTTRRIRTLGTTTHPTTD
ncbi:helix-turn-helix domain-containing protein [Streptomyces sp. NBC_00009]|uniref:helix-turn-helix domain-containing protein n=1 Tax=Streptomyces sp. NBC_00009 TaxID=2975620 RepID=UPI00386B57FE